MLRKIGQLSIATCVADAPLVNPEEHFVVEKTPQLVVANSTLKLCVKATARTKGRSLLPLAPANERMADVHGTTRSMSWHWSLL